MVVAILILSTLSVILVGVVPSAMFGMRSAENRAQAASIARDTIEEMRGLDFDKVVSGNAPSRTSNGTVYHVNVEVGAASIGDVRCSEATARDVRVTVVWKDRTGWKRAEDVQTFTARTVLFNGDGAEPSP